MSFPRYPAYKDSGVEWLGGVPTHWKTGPLKRRFAVTLGKMLQPTPASEADVLLPYLRAGNLGWRGVDISDVKQMWLSPRDRTELLLRRDDVLVSEGGDVGRSCLWQEEIEECYFQNSVNRVRPRGDDLPRYVYYWLSLIKEAGYVDVICNKSTIAHFTAEKLASVLILTPPVEEQRSIASFLDRETAKIDDLIAQQQRLMDVLKEKRQAVISHAVTRGFNSDAPMKDSGVAWLGQVPAHWEVVGMTKYLESLVDYRGRTPTKVEEGVFLITARNIRDGEIDYLASEEFVDPAEYEDVMRRGKPELGDVLFTTEAPLGEVANVDRTDIALAQRVLKFRGKKSVLDNEYLKFWLMGSFAQADMERLATGSTALGIKGSKVVQLRLCLPPYQEQIAIVRMLARSLDELACLAAVCEGAIDLLRERRTALISAAVTGQIDVRALAYPSAA